MPQTGLVSESIISDRENIPRTIAFNKPYGVLSCFTDSDGRQTLADYIDLPGVYAAERLDLEGQGLMILTSTARSRTGSPIRNTSCRRSTWSGLSTSLTKRY